MRERYRGAEEARKKGETMMTCCADDSGSFVRRGAARPQRLELQLTIQTIVETRNSVGTCA